MTVTSLFKKFQYDFDLGRGHPINFWRCEWGIYTTNGRDVAPHPHKANQCPVSLTYFTYRLFFFICFLCFTIYDLYQYQEIHLFLIYFTNWTLTLQIIYATFYIIRLLQICMRHCHRVTHALPDTTEKDYGKRLQWQEKVIWVLYDAVVTFPFIVTLIFWTCLFQGKNYWGIPSLFLHVATAVMACVAGLVDAIPVRISHCLIPMGVGVVYGLFTFLYEKIDLKYSKLSPRLIYPFVDWNNAPWQTFMISCGAVLLAGVMHFCACYGLYKLRRYLKSKLHKRRTDKKKGKNSLEENQCQPSATTMTSEGTTVGSRSSISTTVTQSNSKGVLNKT